MKALVKSANFGVSMLLVLAAIAIAYIAIPAFGNKALIVRSGSMQPTIKVGDLVVVQTQKGLLTPQKILINKYKEGDIVAFSSQKNPKLFTTHRIVKTEIKDGKVFYQTKGDANNAPDNNLVAEENIIGKSTFQLPYFGRLFAFAKSNIGFPLLVIFPALLVIILEMVNIYKEIKRQNRIVQVPMPKENFAGLKIIIPVFLSVMVIHNAFAYFSDTETSVGNTFTAATVFPSPTPSPSTSPTPSPTPGPGSVVINEIMWTGTQGDSADEWVELRNMTSSTINLSNWVVENLGEGGGSSANITIPVGKSIGPNGFFLISNDPKETSNINVDPDFQTSDVSLLNPGEQLRLKDSGGTLIDTADNDGGGWFAGDDPPGQNPKKAMERNNTPGDGTVVGNWHTATSQTNMDGDAAELATPKAANSAP